MTSRRSFLASILALGAAPAIVRPASLMPIWTPPKDIFDAAWVNWDPALTEGSLTRIALYTSDGGVRVLDLAWGVRTSQPFMVASDPIAADSPLRPQRGVFNRL